MFSLKNCFFTRLSFAFALSLFVALSTIVLICLWPAKESHYRELALAIYPLYGWLFFLTACIALLGRRGSASWLRQWGLFSISILMGLFVLISAHSLYPNLLPQQAIVFKENHLPVTETAQRQPMRLLQHNVFHYRKDIKPLVTYLRKAPADILALEEMGLPSVRPLLQDEAIKKRYPYRYEGKPYDLTLLSKWPITKTTVLPKLDELDEEATAKNIRDNYYFFLVSEIKTPQGPLSVVMLHPPHPTRGSWYFAQSEQFSQIAKTVATIKTPYLVVGDFNLTPFNTLYGPFRQLTGLHDPRLSKAALPTWPAYAPAPLRLMLDHVLYSEGVRALKLELLPSTGSDHLPLQFTFMLDKDKTP